MALIGSGDDDDVVLELHGITKHYGRVVACDNVDLQLHRGEIHGILGENGAGKSTLMKAIIGLAIPDRGSMSLDGEPCRILDPVDAAHHGIGMVHQHYSLVDALSVWENVALGERGSFDPAQTRDRVIEELEKLGFYAIPSKANFIFIRQEKINAQELFQELRAKGVLVRYFDKPRIDNYLRITIGTDAEMDEFLANMRQLI